MTKVVQQLATIAIFGSQRSAPADPRSGRRRPWAAPLAAAVRLIVWCNACRHRIESDVAAMAGEYGAATPDGATTWRRIMAAVTDLAKRSRL
jgi:hypothetical protein